MQSVCALLAFLVLPFIVLCLVPWLSALDLRDRKLRAVVRSYAKEFELLREAEKRERAAKAIEEQLAENRELLARLAKKD